MSPEKQRIVLAEYCGWKKEYTFVSQDLGSGGEEIQAWISPSGETSCVKIPDYLGDLNAINEVEKKILDWYDYLSKLQDVVQRDVGIGKHDRNFDEDYGWAGAMINATAVQRAEAFLKTVGKWEN